MGRCVVPGGDMSTVPAVVLNLYSTGLEIARQLGRRGVPVVGVSGSASAPGGASRFCRSLVGPDSLEEPEALLPYLLRLGSELGDGAIVFPTRDADLFFLERHREALGSCFRLALPPRPVLEELMEKDRLALLAERAGIDTPRTVRVRSRDELEARRDQLRFPAVLKPVRANDWRHPGVWAAVGGMKGFKVDGFEECRHAFERVSVVAADALVQEWVPGDEDDFHVLGAVVGRDGEPLGHFTARKLLQYPPRFGLGCLVLSEDNAEVRDLGFEVMRAAGLTGIAEVEFKRDSRTGRLRLIEVNPRHWDQHGLGTASGVELSWLLYRDLAGHPPAPAVRPRPGAVWLHGGGLLGCAREALRSGDPRSLGTVAGALFRRRRWAYWDVADREPFYRLMEARWTRES